jgi:very-long-chain enoyl-CoA reductase
MCIGHYVKRELETLFVHRFSNDTMPFFNVFKNSAHYWFLMGFCSNYYLLHPDYTPPSWLGEFEMLSLTVMFCIFEFFNLMCHITLRNLRGEGSSDRGIPHGWGFQLVSCANYFWESASWFCFAVITQVWGAYLFWIVSSVQMMDWAIKKHQRYKKDFGEGYPKGRKAMFPFFI